jgi:hypothetical protein
MDIRTGVTVYENVFSVDFNGDPLTGATFTQTFYVDGVATTAVTLSFGSINAITGGFSVSFTPTIFGTHQYSLRSSETGTRYISDSYRVLPDSEFDDVTVYVGL